MQAARIGVPADYDARLDGAAVVARGDLRDGVAFVHLFTASSRAGVENGLATALRRIARGGMIWVSWPTRSSNLSSEITDDVPGVALPMGLVDVKVRAVDADWPGLKLAIRKALR